MSKFGEGLLTNNGLQLANKANNGQIQLTFTRAVMSSDDHSNDSTDTIRQLTSLTPFNTIQIGYGQPIGNDRMRYALVFSNTNLKVDSYVRTVGVYASDGTNEYLYSVLVSSAPDLEPAYNGVTPESYKINFSIYVGDNANVQVTVAPMDNVTVEQLSVAVSTADSQASASASSAYSAAQSYAGYQLGFKVQDNLDGTVTLNGQQYSINKTLTSAVDYNTMTTPGTYLCPLSVTGTYANSPLTVAGDSASVILQVLNDNAGDVFQTAYVPGIMAPITRQYSFNKWFNWQIGLLPSDLSNAYSNANSNAQSLVNSVASAAQSLTNSVASSQSSTANVASNAFQYRGYWTDNIMNLTYQPAGTYGIANNFNNGPAGFSGYGVANVFKNTTDTWIDLMDNTNHRWTCHIGSTWQKVIDNDDINTRVLDNQNGSITFNGYTQSMFTTLTAAVDYNTLASPGRFVCPNSVSGTWINSPLSLVGVTGTVILDVVNDNAGDIYQTAYVPSVNSTLYRQYSFGQWTGWIQIANMQQINNLQSQINAIDSAYLFVGNIDNHSDLNSITKPGVYHCYYTLPANVPSQMNGTFPRFKLQVSSFGDQVVNQTIYIFDGYGTNGIPSFFNRNSYSGGSWNPWQHTTS